MFSGLYSPLKGEFNMLLITLSSAFVPPVPSADQLTYTRFEVDKDSSGNIMLVICLVEENILPIALSSFCPFFQFTLGRDPVLCT
jgi:hypothetical protein